MSRAFQLSEADREIIRRCLDAAVRGPFFPEWEFGAIFGGLERQEIQRILETWPDAPDPVLQDVAVTSAMNNLLGYPHRKEDAFRQFVGVSRAEVARVLAAWRGETALEPGGLGYFHRLE